MTMVDAVWGRDADSCPLSIAGSCPLSIADSCPLSCLHGLPPSISIA